MKTRVELSKEMVREIEKGMVNEVTNIEAGHFLLGYIHGMIHANGGLFRENQKSSSSIIETIHESIGRLKSETAK